MVTRPGRARGPARRVRQLRGPEVAERVLKEGELLEGEEREVSVMFVDIRDFTPLAERSSARETVAFLNDVLRRRWCRWCWSTEGTRTSSWATACSRCSARPSACPTTRTAPWRARGPSRARSEERFTERSVRWASGSIPGPSWWAPWAAADGSSSRVIGDAVNISARAERFTRDTGDEVLVTEATHALLTRGREAAGGEGGDRAEGDIRRGCPCTPSTSDVDERFTPPARPLVADA